MKASVDTEAWRLDEPEWALEGLCGPCPGASSKRGAGPAPEGAAQDTSPPSQPHVAPSTSQTPPPNTTTLGVRASMQDLGTHSAMTARMQGQRSRRGFPRYAEEGANIELSGRAGTGRPCPVRRYRPALMRDVRKLNPLHVWTGGQQRDQRGKE